MAEAGIFVRKASGLVRDFAPRDAFMFNVLTMVILNGGAYNLVVVPALFPGQNLLLGIFLTAILGTCMWTTYVFLSTAMPRSGGDWIYQSRILGPSIATPIIIGDIWYLIYWVVFGYWSATVLGINPFFTLVGSVYNIPGLVNFGAWSITPDGYFVIGMIILFFGGWQLVLPLRYYAKVQWFLMASVVLGIISIVVPFIATPNDVFVTRFNDFAVRFLPDQKDYYHTVIQQAAATGFNPRPGFNLYDQMGSFPIVWSLLGWAFWSAQLSGEIKGAAQMRNQNFIMNGSGWFVAIIWAIMAATFINTAGWDFVASAGSLNFAGQWKLPIAPYMTTYVAAIDPNLGTGIMLALFFIMLGTIANAFQIYYNTIIGPIRMGFAMSFDRLLPDVFSKVNERWHTPINFTLLCIFFGGIQIFLSAYVPAVAPVLLPAALSSGAIPYSVTCIAGALFPYRQKAIYDASPAAKYKIGGLPLITILGTIGAIFNWIIIYYWLTVPALGINPSSMVFVLIFYVFGIIWYVGYKAYRARQGINVALAFRTVPPD